MQLECACACCRRRNVSCPSHAVVDVRLRGTPTRRHRGPDQRHGRSAVSCISWPSTAFARFHADRPRVASASFGEVLDWTQVLPLACLRGIRQRTNEMRGTSELVSAAHAPLRWSLVGQCGVVRLPSQDDHRAHVCPAHA